MAMTDPTAQTGPLSVTTEDGGQNGIDAYWIGVAGAGGTPV